MPKFRRDHYIIKLHTKYLMWTDGCGPLWNYTKRGWTTDLQNASVLSWSEASTQLEKLEPCAEMIEITLKEGRP